MRKSTHTANLRIHPSFPPMGNPLPASQGSQSEAPVDMFNYNVALNRQPMKEAYGPTDTPQYG